MDISGLNSYNDYYSGLAANSNAQALSNKINSTGNTTDDDRLMEVCKEFESYLLEQVFKNMEKTIMKDDEGDSTTSQLVDYFKDQTIQELSSQATDQNSLGIAQMLYEQLCRNMGITADKLAQNAAESGAVTSEE